MAKKFLGFTPAQQHQLLSRLGYSGPADRDSMEKFIQSNPAAASKMGNYTQKALARLNPQPQMAAGGTVDPNRQRNAKAQEYDPTHPAWNTVKPPKNPTPTAPPTGGNTDTGSDRGSDQEDRPTNTGNPNQGGVGNTGPGVTSPKTPQEILQAAQQQNVLNSFTNPLELITQATPGQITSDTSQLIDPNTGQVRNPGDVQTATVGNVATATAPDQIKAVTVDTEKVSGKINNALEGLQGETAKASKKATVQGQLEDLMKDFEGGGTPPWASGAMRAAMATMQSRGLGASSMAGAAVVQAAMESAIGIASQDAATQAQFEMKNLDNKQQALIFKTQARITGLLSDQSAENAAKQFNASSKNQTNQFFAGLQESVSKFNADQINAIRQFNAGETNAVNKFNSQMDAARDQFNAQNSLVIAQANAQWRQTIATTNTAMQHEANMQNAQLATGMTSQAMDQLWQRERDLLSFAFQGSESALDRSLSLMLGKMDYALGEKQLDAEEKEGWGQLFGTIARGLFG